MRFMLLMIPASDENTAAQGLPAIDSVLAMAKYNHALWQAGVLLALDGLHPLSMGARVSFADGRARVVDGAAAATSGAPCGYWMIEVGSRDEAIAWASRCPAARGETIEVRQVQVFEDFSGEMQQALDAGVGARVKGAPGVRHPHLVAIA